MCLWVGTQWSQRKMSLMSSDTWWISTCQILFDISMHLENKKTFTITKIQILSLEFSNLYLMPCRCYSNRREEATTRWQEPLTRPPCSVSQREAPISLRYAPWAKEGKELSAPKFEWSLLLVSQLAFYTHTRAHTHTIWSLKSILSAHTLL